MLALFVDPDQRHFGIDAPLAWNEDDDSGAVVFVSGGRTTSLAWSNGISYHPKTGVSH
jgi:hypothetical protein